MSARKTGDTPDIAFTLEQLEQEARPDVPPLRMGVKGKIIELISPMEMEAGRMVEVLDALSASKAAGELGDAATMLKLLPIMIGEENFAVLTEAKVSLGALMKLQEKIEEYYDEALAAAGVDDPKDSTSPSA